MKKFLVLVGVAAGLAAAYLTLKHLAQLDKGHLFVDDESEDEGTDWQAFARDQLAQGPLLRREEPDGPATS